MKSMMEYTLSLIHYYLYDGGQSMSKKLTYEQVKSYIENNDYKLLSKEYKNSKTNLSLQCPEGHKFSMPWSSFHTGRRCPICYGNKKKTIEEIKKYIESYDYKLLSTEYKNSATKLKLKCSQNHIFEIRWNDFQSGSRCSYCYGNKKKNINYIKKYVENQGYQLLSDEYENIYTKLKLKCPEGHIFEMRWNNFQSGSRCPICWWNKKESKAEKEIYKYCKSLYNGKILPNDRSTIVNPETKRYLELDIYIPSIRKAIEFNGMYWHSLPDRKHKDKIKINQCKKLGIDLLVINEEDWISNKEEIISNLQDFIN